MCNTFTKCVKDGPFHFWGGCGQCFLFLPEFFSWIKAVYKYRIALICKVSSVCLVSLYTIFFLLQKFCREKAGAPGLSQNILFVLLSESRFFFHTKNFEKLFRKCIAWTLQIKTMFYLVRFEYDRDKIRDGGSDISWRHN